jgi:centromere protein C
VSGSEFKYQKVFGEDQFIASGVVYIPVGGSKPSKQSKDNSYVGLHCLISYPRSLQVFYVIAGAVQVTVTKTSFVMVPGGMFMVPRGELICGVQWT